MQKTHQHFSIKWKLSLALIATGLSLVIIYVIIAKSVFESDKVSYVYEAQNARLYSLKRELDVKVQQSLFSARSLLATLDNSANIPQAAGELFKENKSLLAIELWDENLKKAIFHIEKKIDVIPTISDIKEKTKSGDIQLLVDKNQNFLLTFKPYQDPNSPLLARVVMDGHDLLPNSEITQSLIMIAQNQILSSVGTSNFDSSFLNEIVGEFANKDESNQARNLMENTRIWNYKSKRFLVSTSKLALGDIYLLALTPEKQALGALNTLYSRSIVFLIFSTLGLIVISLFLAKSLTSNLHILTDAVNEIGKGIFDKTPNIQSKDEVGVLARAFQKMALEIKRLLEVTRDTARMEAELQTAKLVQESLFPEYPTFDFNEIQINGIALTSTECGGDWWYYFIQNDDIYIAIADATGHGTPAALITSAARSVFARIEHENLSLADMMRAWDHSISSCSKKRVMMTGILIKINSITGATKYLSAGHEEPFLFKSTELGHTNTLLDLNMNPSIGDGLANIELEEQSLQLDKKSCLLLYTDGLFAVKQANDKMLSNKRLGKTIASKLDDIHSAKDLTESVLQRFEAHRGDLPLPDDVTIVSIRRI